ncbi:methyltransferase, TIGR04325 family [Leptospira sp. WS60.C2]
MKYAPIVIFVYNRPEHTKRVVDSLLSNKEASQSDLIIYSDAPKNKEHLENVVKVRSYLKEISGFQSIQIVEREMNFGLAKSIINGVTEVVSKYGTVIVLEDDILVSPYFLQFMNKGLETYQKEEKVASIHSYNFPMNTADLEDTYFIRGADCWGWATWQRAWKFFEPDGKKLRDELLKNNLVRDFDYEHTFPFFQMLQNQIDGKNNSWAIRWHASIFLQNKLTLYPRESLVLNIGLDNSGTHCDDNDHWSKEFSYMKDHELPSSIQENKLARKRMIEYFQSISLQPNPSKRTTFRQFIKRLLRLSKRIASKCLRFLIVKDVKTEFTFTGNYRTWEEASSLCSGYDSDNIIQKVKESLQLVRDGKAVYERDSVIFDEIQYSQPLLIGLLFSASLNEGRLKVLDFGGSLGSTYFQNRKFLSRLNHLEWSIVEQEKFVNLGKSDFETEEIRYYHTIEEVVKNRKPNTVLISGVIQYLRHPYEILDLILSYDFQTIIFDRTPFFIEAYPDRITIENVSPEIFKAEYPAWFFNYQNFLNFMMEKYELIESFESNDKYSLADAAVIYRALIFKRKK